jgi:4-hydroxymandelate oxidase
MSIGAKVSSGPHNLRDWQLRAETVLDPATFGYIVGGAADERTMRDNEQAFGRLRLIPRVLRGTAAGVDSTSHVLGARLHGPILVAPFAYQGAFHADGELATARAAREAGLGMCLSTLANTAIEEVAAESGEGLRLFQLYPMADPGLNREMLACAKDAGYRATIVTVDLPPYGVRERELVDPFVLPEHLGLPCIPQRSAGAGSPTPAQTSEMMKLDLSWDDIAGWAGESGLPVIVKGVLAAEDAVLAREHGAAGVIVSNHGGRQLDTAVATVDALPAIADALGGELELWLDGGVRRGTDVVKALALGARAVLVGRPVAYGLAAAGADGVGAVLSQLLAEMRNAMALCGARTLSELGPGLLAPR